MAQRNQIIYHERYRGQTLVSRVTEAYHQFLKIPTIVLISFLIMAAITYYLDRARLPVVQPVRSFMGRYIFGEASPTASLIGSITSSLITVTSITFSILLLAVQQAASSMTHQVIDQFLRRSLNQVIFGFFVGLALFSMIIQATIVSGFVPIFGATVVLVFAVLALYLLLVLIYTTIDQMRPLVIINSIRRLTLQARQHQHHLLSETRPNLPGNPNLHIRVATARPGVLTRIDIDAILDAISAVSEPVEVEFVISIGSNVTYGDTIARLGSKDSACARQVAEQLVNHIQIQNSRQLETDPGFGIEQLRTIGWTTISTSKQNPAVGLDVIQAVRDLIARWEETDRGVERSETSPVAYTDGVARDLFLTLEHLAILSMKSEQMMSYSAILDAASDLFDRVSPAWQQEFLSLIHHLLPLLPRLAMSRDLERSLTRLHQVLAHHGYQDTAAELKGWTRYAEQQEFTAS